ncbi:MAG: hypothetical protein QM757_16265 [Paludibaculum sp.]
MRRVVSEPGRLLWARWHWKAAMVSATIRALLFLAVTLKSGWRTAVSAMAVEFVLRVGTTGFCGAFTQSLRFVQPAWQGAAVTLVLLPFVLQGLDLAVHATRGTPHLRTSMWVSTMFTVLSTLFHVYSTRQGAYLTGPDGTSILDDLRRTPRLVAGFLRSGFGRS